MKSFQYNSYSKAYEALYLFLCLWTFCICNDIILASIGRDGSIFNNVANEFYFIFAKTALNRFKSNKQEQATNMSLS